MTKSLEQLFREAHQCSYLINHGFDLDFEDIDESVLPFVCEQCYAIMQGLADDPRIGLDDFPHLYSREKHLVGYVKEFPGYEILGRGVEQIAYLVISRYPQGLYKEKIRLNFIRIEERQHG